MGARLGKVRDCTQREIGGYFHAKKYFYDWNVCYLFYDVTVLLYNSAHTTAVNTIKRHETSQHTSPSNVNHLVPIWSEKRKPQRVPLTFFSRTKKKKIVF